MHAYACVYMGGAALTVLSILLTGPVPTLAHLLWDVDLVQIHPEADAASVVLEGTFWGPSPSFYLIYVSLTL